MTGVSEQSVFLFRAEVGIRYSRVAGVETCALPNSVRARKVVRGRDPGRAPLRGPVRDRRRRDGAALDDRSEERRVGKQRRSWRGRPFQYRTNTSGGE